MAMTALSLPGASGGVREPYREAPAEEYERFSAGLARLGIPEIDEQLSA